MKDDAPSPSQDDNDDGRKTPAAALGAAPSSSFDLDDDEDADLMDALAAWPMTQAVKLQGRDEGTESTQRSDQPREERKVSESDTRQKDRGEEEDPLEMVTIKLADVLPEHYNGQGLPRSGGKDSRPSRRKRTRFSEVEESAEPVSETHGKADLASQRTSGYLQSSAYDALSFGDFGRYMRNKRAKLKVQEGSLREQEQALLEAAGSSSAAVIAPTAPLLFSGCTIYINGHTVPPYAELRRLIVLHGGHFMAYLDQKSPVTHIVASNLTPKKRIEFAAYRVVTPLWITESIRLARRLAWHDFKVEADAGGAIGSAKLPDATRAIPEQMQQVREKVTSSHPTDSYLASGQMAGQRKALGARARGVGGVRSTYLADATPWGRLTAQKKLTEMQPMHAEAKAAEDGDINSRGGAVRRPPERRRVVSPTAPQETLSGEPEEKKEQQEAKEPPTASELPRQEVAAGEAARPRTPEHHLNLTPEDVEWLRNLETPPKARVQENIEDVATDQDSGVTAKANLAAATSIVTPSKRKAPDVGGSFTIPFRGKSFEAAIGTDPPTSKTPEAADHHHSGHPYSKSSSNLHAAKLLASPSWREQNTATSESFLAGFFAKSRLHYLSTWKGELKDLVSQALKDAGREEGSHSLPKGVNRVIMHIDFDSFFVSVGLRNRPDLKDKPVVVCHAGATEGIGAGENSTSEIASCNYVARGFGVQNGWSLGRARQLCPHIQPIPYDFEGYKDVSIQFYALLLAHADAIEAVSVDEALIDVSNLLQTMRTGRGGDLLGGEGDGDDDHRALLSSYRGHVSSQGEQWTEEKQLAEALRDVIRLQTRCEASIGIGANVLQARLATRYAKPGGSYHLRTEELEMFLAKLDIDDLQGVGFNTRRRFETAFGTANIAELKKTTSQSRFLAELGPKLGKQVWDKMFGIDRSELEGAKQRQSVGAAVNYGIRFANQDEAEKFVGNLAQEVSNRLVNYKLRGHQVNVTIMVRDPAAPIEASKFLGHGICDVHNRSQAMSGPAGVATNDVSAIFRSAWKSITSLGADASELRGIAISCTKLEPTESLGAPRAKAGQSLLNFRVAPATPEKVKTSAVVAPSPLRTSLLRIDYSKGEAPTRNHGGDSIMSATVDESYDDEDGEEDEGTLQPGPFEKLSSQSQRQSQQRHLTPLPDRSASPGRPLLDTGLQFHRIAEPHLFRAQSAEPALRSEEERFRGASAETSILTLPTMSQLDPTVLSELPPAIRMEVLRESKRLASTSTLSGSSLAVTGPAMIRSVSASPAKVKKTTSTLASHQRILPFLGATRSTTLPSRSIRLRSKQQQQQEAHPAWIRDPSKATRAQVSELNIDYDVLRALPEDMQRETLLERFRSLRGQEARVKLAAHRQERTMAEERRVERQRASVQAAIAGAPSAPAAAGPGKSTGKRAFGDSSIGNSSIAPAEALTSATLTVPCPSSAMEELGPKALRVCQREAELGLLLPTLRDKRSAAEVRELLSSWIRRHRNQKPRSNDVAKFSAFLVKSVAGSTDDQKSRDDDDDDDDDDDGDPMKKEGMMKKGKERREMKSRRRSGDIQDEEILAGSCLDDIEKVRDILFHWHLELRNLVGEKASSVHPNASSSVRTRAAAAAAGAGIGTRAAHEGSDEGERGEETSSSKAREGWWKALESVMSEVNSVVIRRFGGRLSF